MKWRRTFCLMTGLAAGLFAASLFAQAPLQIAITNGSAMVSWPNSESFNSLQTATSLSPTVQWSGAAPTYYGGGSVNFPVTNSQQFFRLKQSWPVFQFAVFYNLNLEIDPGALMAINGPVFSNQGIWAATPNVTFNSTVAAAGLVYYQATDPTNDDPWCSGKTDSGTPNGNFLYPPTIHQGPLTLPIGTNNNPNAVEAIVNWPVGTNAAPNAYAYSTNGQAYLFNESDLIISNAANGLPGAKGTNITIWFQDPNNPSSYLTQLNPDLTNKVATITNKYFSFVTNVSYYDFREGDTVQAVQIDVGKLNVWLTNTIGGGGYSVTQKSFHDNGHGIQSIYVYNNVPQNSSTLPAVRMVNAAQLPYTTDPNGIYPATSGLTVTTPQPIYVKGDYNVQTASSAAGASAQTTNTASTYPAALIADAITILSANWNDTGSAYLAGGLLAIRSKPPPTTINAAVLEGIVQSTNSNFSGGVENFLRMEEDWGGVVLQYNGSIAVMFPSIYATSFWPGTGSVYNPPTRHWSFDYNFTNPNKLPALTPMVVNYVTP